MGLQACAVEFKEENKVNCGYFLYTNYRKALISSYSKELGELYEKFIRCCSIEDCVETNEVVEKLRKELPSGIAILAFRSDCDDWFDEDDCKEIYETIKDLEIKEDGEYGQRLKEYHQKFTELFKYASENNYFVRYM